MAKSGHGSVSKSGGGDKLEKNFSSDRSLSQGSKTERDVGGMDGYLEKLMSSTMAPERAPGINAAGQPVPVSAKQRPGAAATGPVKPRDYLDAVLANIAPVPQVRPAGLGVPQPNRLSGQNGLPPMPRARPDMPKPAGVDVPMPRERPAHAPTQPNDQSRRLVEEHLGRGVPLEEMIGGALGAGIALAASELWSRRNGNKEHPAAASRREDAEFFGELDDPDRYGEIMRTGHNPNNAKGAIDADFWESYNSKQIAGPQNNVTVRGKTDPATRGGNAAASGKPPGGASQNYDAPFAAFDHPQIQQQMDWDRQAQGAIERGPGATTKRGNTDTNARNTVESAPKRSDNAARNNVESTIDRTMDTTNGVRFSREQEAGLAEVNRRARSGDMQGAQSVFNSLDIDIDDPSVANAVAKALTGTVN